MHVRIPPTQSRVYNSNILIVERCTLWMLHRTCMSRTNYYANSSYYLLACAKKRTGQIKVAVSLQRMQKCEAFLLFLSYYPRLHHAGTWRPRAGDEVTGMTPSRSWCLICRMLIKNIAPYIISRTQMFIKVGPAEASDQNSAIIPVACSSLRSLAQ